MASTELAEARAQRSDDQALIAHLKLEIAKLNRQRYGPHAERTAGGGVLLLNQPFAANTSTTLKVLHDIVQATIGWFDYHLWEFTIAGHRYGLPMDEDWGPSRARTPPRSACARC